jgi:hypothetical protein
MLKKINQYKLMLLNKLIMVLKMMIQIFVLTTVILILEVKIVWKIEVIMIIKKIPVLMEFMESKLTVTPKVSDVDGMLILKNVYQTVNVVDLINVIKMIGTLINLKLVDQKLNLVKTNYLHISVKEIVNIMTNGDKSVLKKYKVFILI